MPRTTTILLHLFFLFSASAVSTDAYPSIPGTDPGACGLSSGGENLIPVRREVYGDGRIFDISHRYVTNMPAFGSNDGVGQFLWLPASMKNGSLANNSEMKLPTHTGTHVDAPGHVIDRYFDAGFDVDTLDLEVLNGPALLVDVPRNKNITAEVMESLKIPQGVRRVLFRTLNTDRRLMFKKEFDTSYVGFMKDGAEWLVKNTDIKLVGIDYLSVAAYDDLIPSHLVFLEGREHILVEGLKLDDIQPGIYSLHCLPLRYCIAFGYQVEEPCHGADNSVSVVDVNIAEAAPRLCMLQTCRWLAASGSIMCSNRVDYFVSCFSCGGSNISVFQCIRPVLLGFMSSVIFLTAYALPHLYR